MIGVHYIIMVIPLRRGGGGDTQGISPPLCFLYLNQPTLSHALHTLMKIIGTLWHTSSTWVP